MIFFDAHVHIYPAYSLDALLSAFAGHAERLAPGAENLAMAVMLREFQPTLASVLTPASETSRWRLEPSAEGTFAATDGTRRIFLLPARQVAAKERIEALGLFGESLVPDGLPLAETIAKLRSAGFQPVLAWGLGKWLFKRAPLVDAAISDAVRARKPLLIGDSALRPTFWPTPRPYRRAKAQGLRVIYGSDPLPRAGDEHCAGRYATLLDAPFDPHAPATSLLVALSAPSANPLAIGRRHGLAGTLRRMR